MAGDSAAVQAMAFAAREIQGFAGHMVEALTQFADTGEFPESLFGDVEPAKAGPVKRKRKAKGPKKERAKRKPSAFNQYVKEQIAVLRARDNAEGQNNNNTFKEAVANWKKLPDAERKAYTENFKAAEAAKAAALEKGAPAEEEEEEEEETPEAQVEEEEDEEEEEEEEEPPKEPTPPPPAPKKEKKRKDKEGADKEAKKKAKKEKAAAAAPAAPPPAPAAAAPPAPAADPPKKKKKKNKDKEKNKQ